MPALKRTIKIEFFPAKLTHCFPLLKQREVTRLPFKPVRRIGGFQCLP
jgi:hypothetical protein